jgi:hypothetical protein
MSTINYTYNVIVDRFRQFAAGHFQLRRFTHGEISQADLEKEAEWPWLHVKPRAINYSPGTRSFQFEIFISDLPRDKEDKTGYQAESITDCSLIFQDLINEIYLGNMFGTDVVLTRPVNSEPFVEQYTHTLTGVTGTIELQLDYDWSACSIPASWNYNTPTDSGTDGWGALQFIESLDQNGVYVSLLNDEETPGNSYYYGTDSEGVKGWHAIVDNIGLTCETLPECATIISIVDDIAALQSDKVDKIAGKGLSTEDYTTAEKSKLAGIQAGAEVNVNADWNATSGDAQILNKPTIPSIAGLVPETRTLTINGTTQDLSANRTFTIATGLTVGTTPITSGTVGRVLFEGTGNVLQESANLFWDNTNSRLGIGTATPKVKINSVTSAQSLGYPTLGAMFAQASLFLSDNTNNYGLVFGINSTTGNAWIQSQRVEGAATAYPIILNPISGNVLIGTTTDAGFKLDVNGTARILNNLTVGNSASLWRIVMDVTSGSNPGGYLNWTFSDGFTYYRQYSQSGFHNYETTSASGWGHRWISQGTISMVLTPTQNLLIGTTTNIASSKLTVTSTTQGFLPPRMTNTQKLAIASPAAGLVVYDTTLNKLCVYTTTWETITSI